MHHSCMTEIFNILSPVMISSASFRLMYNGTWQWRPNTLNSHTSYTDPLFNLYNFRSSFPRGSFSASAISSSSRITHGRRTGCFLGRVDWNKDLEMFDVKSFINCKIELLRRWCHNTFGGLKYGMINALGQAINVPKASPTNWISEVSTGTWAWGSRTSLIITRAY